jgi:transcription initiation factor IIE alpha subunit
MIHLTLDKVLYTDTELATMLGISKRHLRNLRNRGLIEYCNTKPIRYTRNMIEDFIKAIETNPNLLAVNGKY